MARRRFQARVVSQPLGSLLPPPPRPRNLVFPAQRHHGIGGVNLKLKRANVAASRANATGGTPAIHRSVYEGNWRRQSAKPRGSGTERGAKKADGFLETEIYDREAGAVRAAQTYYKVGRKL